VNLGAPINTPAADGAPSLSFDGQTLYFDSTRDGGLGLRDIYVTTRSKEDGGGDSAHERAARLHLADLLLLLDAKPSRSHELPSE
jgi:WD40-like Beta Propeller Repeat